MTREIHPAIKLVIEQAVEQNLSVAGVAASAEYAQQILNGSSAEEAEDAAQKLLQPSDELSRTTKRWCREHLR